MASDAVVPARPRWWIAALLNLISAGVGYLYVRRPRRALIIFLLNMAMLGVMWHGLGGWLAAPWVMLGAIPAAFLLMAVPAVDAARLAGRTTSGPEWYNRWWIYAGLVVASIAISSPVNLDRSVRSFYAPASSMLPTLNVGDRFLVNMRAYEGRAPERGDVVIFELPRERSTIYVKRVIGLPGDEIQVKGGVVHLNGTALPTETIREHVAPAEGGWPERSGVLKREQLGQGRSAVIADMMANGPLDNTQVFKVPADHYFMLGDNRDNSTDSRDQSPRYGVGYVPRANIIGKVSWIYWSGDWSRIGSRID